jgi:hypothetical protein
MTARRLFLAGVVAVLALAGCAGSTAPSDAGADPGDPLDVVMADPGPRDPGPPDVPSDPGVAEEAAADESGAEGVDDPGPTDPGTDPGPEFAGKVELAPYTMEFGYVQAGANARRPLQVRNLGPGELRVDRFRVTGSADYAPELGFGPITVGAAREWPIDPPRILAANETWSVTIVFAPTVDADGLAEIEVLTSDPTRTGNPPKAFLRGNLQRTCARWVPDTLEFGSVAVGESVSHRVTLQSCGGLDLVVRDISLEPSWVAAGASLDFALFPDQQAPTAAAPVTIPAGGLQLRVVWAPTVLPSGLGEPVSGNLVVLGNQFPGATFLPLAGTLLAGRCAVPKIRAFENATVPACTVLSASGAESTSFFAPVNTFTWAVDQPAGNDGAPVPDGARPGVALFAGVPGTYTFRLQVQDAQGHPSCGEDTRSVTVTQRLAAAVALTWRRADGAPLQSGAGPDLDLHFLNCSSADQNGGCDSYWYDTYDDCYYGNPTPDVGNTWYLNGGVSLVSQSQDGMLPEAVVLQNLLANCPKGRRFRFGVIHSGVAGTGDAIATLKTYASGLALHSREVTLKPGDLWDAGIFTCGDNTVLSSVTEIAGPRIVPNFGL